MELDIKTKLSLTIYKYITSPLIAGFVFLMDNIFMLLDKVIGNEAFPMTDKELLQEYMNYMEDLSENNVPDNLKDIFPLAKKWGIGDDALRGDVTAAATEEEKLELISALTGKLSHIYKWLESFPDEIHMSDEAATFMYLIEAVDELYLDVRCE